MPEFDWQQACQEAASNGDERPTWAYDWPAGEILAECLAELIDCRGKHVCDLGCGRGRLGRQALSLHAERVCFADGSQHPLAYLQQLVVDARASFHQHRWGAPIPEAPYDLILGGDILYRPECFQDLLHSIATSLTATGKALLADPRNQLEPVLADLTRAEGLRWQTRRLEQGITLVTLPLDQKSTK
jgi:predicted nicotinamide N-methyase